MHADFSNGCRSRKLKKRHQPWHQCFILQEPSLLMASMIRMRTRKSMSCYVPKVIGSEGTKGRSIRSQVFGLRFGKADCSRIIEPKAVLLALLAPTWITTPSQWFRAQQIQQSFPNCGGADRRIKWLSIDFRCDSPHPPPQPTNDSFYAIYTTITSYI